VVLATELLNQWDPHLPVRFKLLELERVENVTEVTGDQDFAPSFLMAQRGAPVAPADDPHGRRWL
jgi:hypothetical protein